MSSFIDKSTAISRSDSIIQKEKKVGHLLSDEEALALVHDSESVLDGPSLNGNSKEWLSLISTVTLPKDLDQYLKPSEDPNCHVEFDDDDAYAARENWGNALVGYFIGLTPIFFSD